LIRPPVEALRTRLARAIGRGVRRSGPSTARERYKSSLVATIARSEPQRRFAMAELDSPELRAPDGSQPILRRRFGHWKRHDNVGAAPFDMRANCFNCAEGVRGSAARGAKGIERTETVRWIESGCAADSREERTQISSGRGSARLNPPLVGSFAQRVHMLRRRIGRVDRGQLLHLPPLCTAHCAPPSIRRGPIFVRISSGPRADRVGPF
jgi:hypothetical protein